MDFETFRRVVSSFADKAADIDVAKGTLLLSIRQDIIEAEIIQRPDGLHVIENGVKWPATQWVCERLAQLPLLATRITEYIAPENCFVPPKGEVLDDINESPDEILRPVTAVSAELLSVLDKKPAGVTTVMYLTSDAGEGKTTLINHAAIEQARLYKEKKTDWLILPVSLGGRTFMRFDDIIVGTLMNRLRFNVMFYDSFLELVRLGAIVPALDGFEEMFVEGSADDAISALGTLMQAMHSSGAAIIAARKAYFQYKNLRAQTRLLDSMCGESVSFSRIQLLRWDKAQFVEYAKKRAVEDPVAIYGQLSNQLSQEHPLLTRAFLVGKLLDITGEATGRESLLDKLRTDPADYFRQFLASIIKREAEVKWIDKSGEPAHPLLTVEEHFALLSEVALEMWTVGTDRLPQDIMTLVAELFADNTSKNRVITQQVVERIKQHALITTTEMGRYSFDHEEFYHFFLGEAIGNILHTEDISRLKHVLSQGVLPRMALEAAARTINRAGNTVIAFADLLNQAILGESRISMLKENLCSLAIHVFDLAGVSDATISGGAFPANVLNGKRVENAAFHRCYFQKTALFSSTLASCEFVDCDIDGFECDGTSTIRNVVIRDCKILSFSGNADDLAEFVPSRIDAMMRQAGFDIERMVTAGTATANEVSEVDPEIQVLERALRPFLRSTGVAENTLRRRLGPQASLFFDKMLPALEQAKVFQVVPFLGKGTQKHFYKIGTSFDRVASALQSCGGEYSRFVQLISQ